MTEKSIAISWHYNNIHPTHPVNLTKQKHNTFVPCDSMETHANTITHCPLTQGVAALHAWELSSQNLKTLLHTCHTHCMHERACATAAPF